MKKSVIERAKTKKGKYRYRQIADDIAARISIGVYPPGSALPTMRNLARGYNVALMTVVQALNTMSDEGAIEVRAGVGSFVPGSKSRKQSESAKVGLVLAGDTAFTGWHMHFLDGLKAGLDIWKTDLKYYFFNPAMDNWDEICERINTDNIKVLLRMPNPGHHDEERISANLSALPMPVITVGSYDSPTIKNRVSYDLAKITAFSVKRLVDRGHKKLAVFHSGRDKLYLNYEVSEGFHLGLEQCGIKYEPQMEVVDYNSHGEVCMERLYNSDYLPTGIIMTEAFMAGVSQWLESRRKRKESIECVAIVGTPELSTSLLQNFVAYMLIPSRHLGYETGVYAEKVVNDPENALLKYYTPFSMLTIVEQDCGS